MTDLVWPNGVRMSSVEWRHVSNSDSSLSQYSGAIQTVSRPGDRLRCVVSVRNAKSTERAKLRALAAALRGRTNRIYLSDLSYTGRRRGSFSAPELFSNADFSNSTTGWFSDAKYSLSASDGVLRSTVLKYAATGFPAYQDPATTLYAPYACRVVVRSGRGTFSSIATLVDNAITQTITGGAGYSVCSGNVQSAGAHTGVFDFSSTGLYAGDYFDILFASAARCAQVDGGGNLFLRSDEFGNASWTKFGCSVLTDVFNGPDGSAVMDAIQEDSSNGGHYVYQAVSSLSASAGDYMIACVVAANFRSYCALTMTESAGGTSLQQYFNLTGSGSVGSSGSTGGGWSGRRAFAKDLGNNRILCVLIGRKTSAATSITGIIGAASADGTSSYIGNNGVGGSAIGIWRGTIWPTSMPSLPVQTTSAAASASTQSTSSIYVKGLPVSTTGLLKVGDQVEIDKQIKFLVADVNTDATGTALFQLDSPCARALSNETPIIIEKPMAKFYLVNDPEYPTEPGDLSDFTFEFEQDLNS